MAAPTVPGSRLLPIHQSPAWSDPTTVNVPHSAIQSITMGIRVGGQKFALGYIHKFSFDMKRDNKPIYQIEPYPDIFGDATATPSGISGNQFDDGIFNEETGYWPGEAIEIIPGKMGVIEIKLNRYSLYTGNLMSAMMRATGSGVYENSTQLSPNIADTEATDKALYYISILQQVRPFDIYQIFVSPITGGALWGRKFGGCWFSTIGEEAPDSDKNEPIIENGTVQATYVRPLTSSLQKQT